MLLIQYATWYKLVYSLPPSDRPDDEVIDDDAALDTWWETYQRDIMKKAGHKGNPKYTLENIPEFRGG